MGNNLFRDIACGQISSASLSLLASSAIAIAIFRSDDGLSSPYRRIILGLSLSDILQSIAVLTGPFAVPSFTPTPIAQWAIGNNASCQTNGFLFNFASISTPLYMFGLCLYTVLKIKTNITDERFARTVEKPLHWFIVLSSGSIAVAGIITKSVNSSILGNFCTFAVFPTGCRQRPDIFGECDPKQVRNVNFFLFTATLAVPFACFFGIILCMGAISCHIIKKNRILGRRARFTTQLRSRSSARHEDNDSDDDDNDNSLRKDRDRTSVAVLEAKSLQQNRSQDKIRLYSREIITQAFYFVISYVMTFSFFWALYITILVGKQPPTFLVYTAAYFYPLCGFFNVLVYTRPKISRYRIENTDASWFRAFWIVVKAGADVPDSKIQDTASYPHAEKSVAFRAKMHYSSLTTGGCINNESGSFSRDHLSYRSKEFWSHDDDIDGDRMRLQHTKSSAVENNSNSNPLVLQESRNSDLALVDIEDARVEPPLKEHCRSPLEIAVERATRRIEGLKNAQKDLSHDDGIDSMQNSKFSFSDVENNSSPRISQLSRVHKEERLRTPPENALERTARRIEGCDDN